MTVREFNKLSVGDIVCFMHGPDTEAAFQVVFIEDYDNICLRAMNGSTFAPTHSNSHSIKRKLKIVTGSGLITLKEYYKRSINESKTR